MTWDTDFPIAENKFLGSVSELLSLRGETMEVAILSLGAIGIEFEKSDNWNGGTYEWNLLAQIPATLYARLTRNEINASESKIRNTANELTSDGHYIGKCDITPVMASRENWREEMIAWLRGEGINNQGRVRSDNVAFRQEDGLLFRSMPEIHLYRALKKSGLTFAPLAVFLKGGSDYQRIEPDFVIFKDKVLMVVEVDGDTVHQESPAVADERIRIFKYEGAFIERILASKCDTAEKAKASVDHLVQVLARITQQR
jgi:hypothetical protein